MDELLCKLDFSCCLNSSRGRPRNSAATLSRGASSASAEGNSESGWESSACTAWSSWSALERLGMGPPHARPQVFQSAKLELLDGSFAAAQFLRNVAHALLLHKTQDDDAVLVRRQLVYQPKQSGALFHLAHGDGIFDVLGGVGQLGFTAGTLPLAGNGIGGHAIEPGGKGHASPLKTVQISQGAVKNVGSDVLGLGAVAHAADHERVHALEVALVELSEAAGVALCRFDELALVLGFQFGSLQRFSPAGVPCPIEINRGGGKKVTGVFRTASSPFHSVMLSEGATPESKHPAVAVPLC